MGSSSSELNPMSSLEITVAAIVALRGSVYLLLLGSTIFRIAAASFASKSAKYVGTTRTSSTLRPGSIAFLAHVKASCPLGRAASEIILGRV